MAGARVTGYMPHTPHPPHATPQQPPPEATPESIRASVIVERRRFPRELPKPDVVELNSDSAWLPFQVQADADSDAPPDATAAPPH